MIVISQPFLHSLVIVNQCCYWRWNSALRHCIIFLRWWLLRSVSHPNQPLCQPVPHSAFIASLLFKSKTLEGCDSRGDLKIRCPSFPDRNHLLLYSIISCLEIVINQYWNSFTLMIIPSMMLLTLTGTVFSRSDHWLNIWSKDLKRCIFQVVKFRLMKNWCSGKVNSDLNSTYLTRDVSLT